MSNVAPIQLPPSPGSEPMGSSGDDALTRRVDDILCKLSTATAILNLLDTAFMHKTVGLLEEDTVSLALASAYDCVVDARKVADEILG